MPTWTTPAIPANGDLVLSSFINEQLIQNSEWLKSRPFANVVMPAIITTTSTSFVELTESRITLTCTGGNVLIAACGICSNDTVASVTTYDIAVDGTRYGDTTVGLSQVTAPANAYPDCLSLVHFTSTPPSVGARVFSIYWKTSASTARILTRFFALEIR
jgi:hypothetical protein